MNEPYPKLRATALLVLATVVAACEVVPALIALRWAETALQQPVASAEAWLPLTTGILLACLLILRAVAARAFSALSWHSARQFVREGQHGLLRDLAHAEWSAVSRMDQGSVRLNLTTQAEEQRALLLRMAESASKGVLFIAYFAGFFLAGYRHAAYFLALASIAGLGLAFLYRRMAVSERAGRFMQAFRHFMASVESLLHFSRILRLGPAPSVLAAHTQDALRTVDREEKLLRRAMFGAQMFRYGLFGAGALLSTALLMAYSSTAIAAVEGLIAARALMAVASALSGLGTVLPRWWKLSAHRARILKSLDTAGLGNADPVAQHPAREALHTLELRNLSFAYPDPRAETRPVLQNLDLSLQRGRIACIEGESGAGKSTLADVLAGLLIPQSGTVECDGQVLGSATAALRRAAMIVPPSPAFVDGGIRANVALFAPDSADDVVIAALNIAAADFALEELRGTKRIHERDPQQLSHGQRQRLAIARALLARPKLLILDEALSGLDHETQGRILKYLAASRDERITVIITHDSRAIPEAVLDFRGRLQEGRLQALAGADHNSRFAGAAR